ncbi:MAG: type II toxin-antitoxin system PemK/MazF family toxin [candidate division NC10 bacterium]|nr:type II toxin-antitoxin system PemK/MazF family toxin [candidate division NC10 bacterium]
MTRPLRKGDLILVPFPFTDLTAVKYRPAVILTPEPTGPDLVVAYLSSVIPSEPLPPAHLLVSPDHPEFRETGLKRASVIRVDKLMTVSRSRVRRRLGRLGPSLLAQLHNHFRLAFGL